MIKPSNDNIDNRNNGLQDMDISPYGNIYTDSNNPNPYSTDNNEFSSDPNAYSRDDKNPLQDDMKFIPLFDYNNLNNVQWTNEDSMNFDLEEAHKCLDLILKSDISNMPFIPNPYYMMDMNKSNTTNPIDDTQRQPRPSHKGPKHGHNFKPHFFPYYPYYPNYPYYNTPPYFYPYPYAPNNVNPLTFLLFSSLFR